MGVGWSGRTKYTHSAFGEAGVLAPELLSRACLFVIVTKLQMVIEEDKGLVLAPGSQFREMK